MAGRGAFGGRFLRPIPVKVSRGRGLDACWRVLFRELGFLAVLFALLRDLWKGPWSFWVKTRGDLSRINFFGGSSSFFFSFSFPFSCVFSFSLNTPSSPLISFASSFSSTFSSFPFSFSSFPFFLSSSFPSKTFPLLGGVGDGEGGGEATFPSMLTEGFVVSVWSSAAK